MQVIIVVSLSIIINSVVAPMVKPDTRTADGRAIKRRQIIYEIFETEQSYVVSLKYCIKEFEAIAKLAKGGERVNKLLISLLEIMNSIVGLHESKFLFSLRKHWETAEESDHEKKETSISVDDLCKQFNDRESDLKIYTNFNMAYSYLNSAKNAAEKITYFLEIEKKRKRQSLPVTGLTQAIEPSPKERRRSTSSIPSNLELNQNGIEGQTLDALLIMPTQRLPRYKLLLDDLIKVIEPISNEAGESSTGTNELPKSNLHVARNLIDKACIEGNDAMTVAERENQLEPVKEAWKNSKNKVDFETLGTFSKLFESMRVEKYATGTLSAVINLTKTSHPCRVFVFKNNIIFLEDKKDELIYNLSKEGTKFEVQGELKIAFSRKKHFYIVTEVSQNMLNNYPDILLGAGRIWRNFNHKT